MYFQYFLFLILVPTSVINTWYKSSKMQPFLCQEHWKRFYTWWSNGTHSMITPRNISYVTQFHLFAQIKGLTLFKIGEVTHLCPINMCLLISNFFMKIFLKFSSAEKNYICSGLIFVETTLTYSMTIIIFKITNTEH